MSLSLSLSLYTHIYNYIYVYIYIYTHTYICPRAKGSDTAVSKENKVRKKLAAHGSTDNLKN